jgi:hypothetical protein
MLVDSQFCNKLQCRDSGFVQSAFPITLSCYPRQLDTFKIAIFGIDGSISVEPAKAMWFSLTE